MTREEAIEIIEAGGRVAHPDFPKDFFYEFKGVIVNSKGIPQDKNELFSNARANDWVEARASRPRRRPNFQAIISKLGGRPKNRDKTLTPQEVSEVRKALELYTIEEINLNLGIRIETIHQIKKARPPYNY